MIKIVQSNQPLYRGLLRLDIDENSKLLSIQNRLNSAVVSVTTKVGLFSCIVPTKYTVDPSLSLTMTSDLTYQAIVTDGHTAELINIRDVVNNV
ncbi:hypothetical protein CXF80_18220 [Shewanella sp. Actino-trap-3]|nr:hypothetical protein CXF80_18220 [Shewanella sp. Actino-trap-3]